MHRPFSELGKYELSFDSPSSPPEKESQKPLDVFARELLKENPELDHKIVAGLSRLQENNKAMPLLHFTSEAVRQGDTISPTGFVENIKAKGFEKRNSNVAAFVERGQKTELAQPQDYLNETEKFIKSLWQMVQRYSHHGTRVNKDRLAHSRGQGEGIPAVVLIDGTNVKLEKGGDYDDHYLLAETVEPSKIIGELNLDSYRPYREHLPEIIEKLLQLLESYK